MERALAIAGRCVIMRRREISWAGTASDPQAQLSADYFGAAGPERDREGSRIERAESA